VSAFARDLVRGTGRTGLAVAAMTGAVVVVVARTFAALARGHVDRQETLRHIVRFGYGSMPVLLATSFLVGGIVAVQGLNYVDRYNATEVFGWASALSSFREVGPLMLGLALAARVGTKNTAELASLAAFERLDALQALGLDVFRTVVAPRVTAITMVGVLAFSLTTTTILLTSFVLAWAVGDQRLAVSFSSMTTYLPARHVVSGLMRMSAFALVLAATTTAAGLDDSRDPSKIGARVFASSVASMSVIVVLNLVLTFLEGA
jgi:phospholipid/cholesterol/gamma-HCH transport system permease protein